MAQIRPFAGIRYSDALRADLSDLIAPPYDVLDEQSKARLQARHPNNIVNVDLPHLPAKSVGPDEAYAEANVTLQAWMSAGILRRDARAAFYAYSQQFSLGQRNFHRRGFLAAVRLSPFGQGQVIPHEKTYPDAIEDRLKLTRATEVQLSPIFGVFSDPRGEIVAALFGGLGKPVVSATLDDVRNDLWIITDSEKENAVIDLMGRRPIYIADGHHRYTMALQYQKELAAASGAALPANHPANWCMFDLLAMQEEGMLVLPTHRIVGSMPSFSIETLKKILAADGQVVELNIDETGLPNYIEHVLPKQPAATFGLFDGTTRKTWQITIRNEDVLTALEPRRSPAWRRLDVAILQRFLLDERIKPAFGVGRELSLSYTADSAAVAGMTDGARNQIALLLKGTPLHTLEELGKSGEVMPQKSTFFYPKLATGLVMNPLG